MCKVEEIAVPTGLQIRVRSTTGAWGDFYNIVTGELEFPVMGERLIFHEKLDILVKKLNSLANTKAEARSYEWRAYMAYCGRLWFVEPDVSETYKLGYMDYPMAEDWSVTGVVTLEY